MMKLLMIGNEVAEADMIFVKTFTVADFGHVMFYPESRNSLEY